MTALFAAHFVEWGYIKKPPVAFLSTLGNYTGSNNIFSFFAPGLSNQPYVVYVEKDVQGDEKRLILRELAGFSQPHYQHLRISYDTRGPFYSLRKFGAGRSAKKS